MGDVHLFPMPSVLKVSGNSLLEGLFEAEARYHVQRLWSPSFKLPTNIIEYISAVCVKAEPEVRQLAVLLIKRNVCHRSGSDRTRGAEPALQLVALTCANLAVKYWETSSRGTERCLTEQELHTLSRNSFTRQDFINAETAVLQALGCIVQWEGTLIAEWVSILLALAAPLFANPSDADSVEVV